MAVFLALIILYTTTYYLDKYTFRKACSVYGNAKISKNKTVQIITSNSLLDFVEAYWHYIFPSKIRASRNSVKLTKQEHIYLRKIGLEQKESQKPIQTKKYTKIIFIVVESLNIDFIHTYNKTIPKEASFYFDELLNNYFHLNNFYTSNMPTDYGMTALLKSKIDLNMNSESLYTILQKEGYSGYYMVALSKYYGLMSSYYPKAFGFQHYISSETLEKEYGNKQSGWGFHDDILFDKAFKIIKENQNNKVFLTIKEIDFHQPGAYCGFDKTKLPISIQKSDVIIKSLYWKYDIHRRC
jgi:hypothetical protein